MLRIIAFMFLAYSCICIAGLSRGSRPLQTDTIFQEVLEEQDSLGQGREERKVRHNEEEKTRRYQADSKGIPPRSTSEASDSQDLLTSLLNCKPFGRFMVSLKEAQIDLLSLFKENTRPSHSVSGRKSVLTRRARLWIGKFQVHVRRVFRSCLLTPSLRTALKDQLNATSISKLSRSLKPETENSVENIESLSADDRMKPILSASNPMYLDAGTATESAGKKLPRGSKRRSKHRNSFKITSKRRRVTHLVHDVLGMLSRDGEIDVATLFHGLATLSEDRFQQLNSIPGSHVKVTVEGKMRDVAPYFLSVAVGARIIQHGKLSELARSTRFLTLSRGLSPAILRYGGTYAMFVLYDPDNLDELLSSPEETSIENPDEGSLEGSLALNTDTVSFGALDEVGVPQGGDDDIIIVSRRPHSDPSVEDVDESQLLNDDVIVRRQEGDDKDCPLGSEWHSYYKSKPQEDSTYNLLAAMISAGGEGIEHMQDEPFEFKTNSCDCNSCNVLEYVNFTMTADDWSTLADFAEAVGMKLLFDVNQLYRTPDLGWDPTNARMILRDAAARNDSVLWQLGNEPNSYLHKFGLNFTGSQDAQEFLLFRQELTDFFDNPAIIGPDVTRPHHPSTTKESAVTETETCMESAAFLKDFLSNLEFNITAISWHQYYIDGRTATLDDFLSFEIFDYLAWQIPEIVKIRDEWTPHTPIWLTETSSAWGGGAKDLSNRYADGFSWLDKLGMAAAAGIDVVTRQTLYQGNYALIDDDINPRPSYWLSLIYKTLVGERVLNLTIEGASNTTRLYAHCQRSSPTSFPGNVVIFGMNLSNTTVDIEVEGMQSLPTIIEQYLLEPEDGDLHSNEMLLNGEVLKMTSDEELPELMPVLVPPQIFQIPPTTFGFWVILDANVLDCYE